jgi:hypothetical protein
LIAQSKEGKKVINTNGGLPRQHGFQCTIDGLPRFTRVFDVNSFALITFINQINYPGSIAATMNTLPHEPLTQHHQKEVNQQHRLPQLLTF